MGGVAEEGNAHQQLRREAAHHPAPLAQGVASGGQQHGIALLDKGMRQGASEQGCSKGEGCGENDTVTRTG